MIVLDASVLIAYLDAEDAQHDRSKALLAREIDDELAISSLTLAEVLVLPARENRIAEVRGALGEMEVQELNFPTGSAATLAEIRATTGLKMPDCCVLLAVEKAGARLATFDERLARVATARQIVVLER